MNSGNIKNFKMADEERKAKHKQTKDFKGKSKTRWRKPGNLLSIGNKEKGHAFVEKRKKIAVREYKKLLQKTREEHRLQKSSDIKAKPNPKHSGHGSNATTFKEGNTESCLQGIRKQNHQLKQKSVNRLAAAESEFKKRKLEKEKQIKERELTIQKHREEVREKMKKRRETFGRLNRRTRKGQPIMSHQIEHLLGKIQSQT